MEIKRLSEYEIKVILNEKDMQIMNISFEDFEKNNKRSKDFLSELMFKLKETGLIKISKATEIHKKYSEKIIKSSLYQLPSGHALIFTIGYARSTVAKKALLKTCATDNVIINKIKEYSPLLSSTPFEKLNYFS